MKSRSKLRYIPPKLLKSDQNKELYHHLNLIPYLRMPFDFDFKTCMNEALKLLPLFVAHKDDTLSASSQRTGIWKSLALRAVDGDPTKTLYHNYYDMPGRQFEMTRISTLCPTIVSFLKAITDFDQCQRIRLMLLEPDAEIRPHSDAVNKNVLPSINIALNMPKECRFMVDCNWDGSHHPYTVQLPFKAGDIMIVNIAKFHYVVNNSKLPRIHIILEGPLRFTPNQLLVLARRQNRICSKSELMRSLVHKYSALGSQGLPQNVMHGLGSYPVQK